MSKFYRTTYQCPICNIEKYFIGKEFEEPVESPICCAPMFKKAFKPLDSDSIELKEVEYPAVFKEAARILDQDLVKPLHARKTMENLKFDLHLNIRTRRVLNRVSSYFGASPKGVNSFINDAILFYEYYIHILKSPELYKIARDFDRAKIRAIREWIRNQKGKKYSHLFAEDIPTFGEMLDKVMNEDLDDEQKDIAEDIGDFE